MDSFNLGWKVAHPVVLPKSNYDKNLCGIFYNVAIKKIPVLKSLVI